MTIAPAMYIIDSGGASYIRSNNLAVTATALVLCTR